MFAGSIFKSGLGASKEKTDKATKKSIDFPMILSAALLSLSGNFQFFLKFSSVFRSQKSALIKAIRTVCHRARRKRERRDGIRWIYKGFSLFSFAQ
jgi:hypothetical protein